MSSFLVHKYMPVHLTCLIVYWCALNRTPYTATLEPLIVLCTFSYAASVSNVQDHAVRLPNTQPIEESIGCMSTGSVLGVQEHEDFEEQIMQDTSTLNFLASGAEIGFKKWGGLNKSFLYTKANQNIIKKTLKMSKMLSTFIIGTNKFRSN